MLSADRDGVDTLAAVLGRVSRVVVGAAAAEDAALTITTRFLTRSGPAWLLRAGDQVRLDVLTVHEVLDRRREVRAAPAPG